MVAGLKAAIGVKARRKNQHGLGHKGEASSDRLPKNRTAFLALVIENVATFFLEKAAVNVHAVSCFVIDGFRHETGNEVVPRRNRSNTSLHPNNLIRKRENIIAMGHVDFELGGGRFLNDALIGQALNFEGLAQLIKHIPVAVELVEGVQIAAKGLVLLERLTQGAIVTGVGQQTEFQFGRHTGNESALPAFTHEPAEYLPGIAQIGGAVLVHHGHDQLTLIDSSFGKDRSQRLLDGQAVSVDIPIRMG